MSAASPASTIRATFPILTPPQHLGWGLVGEFNVYYCLSSLASVFRGRRQGTRDHSRTTALCHARDLEEDARLAARRPFIPGCATRTWINSVGRS